MMSLDADRGGDRNAVVVVSGAQGVRQDPKRERRARCMDGWANSKESPGGGFKFQFQLQLSAVLT